MLSVWWLFRAPKVEAAPVKPIKVKSGSKPSVAAPAPAPVEAASASNKPGVSISSLLKSQAKKKGPVAPTHVLFRRLFKSSSAADVTAFASSPDGRVSVMTSF